MDSASEDFDKFKQKYILTSVVLGKGGFGQVFLGRTTTTGMNVAIKIATSSELESEYKVFINTWFARVVVLFRISFFHRFMKLSSISTCMTHPFHLFMDLDALVNFHTLQWTC